MHPELGQAAFRQSFKNHSGVEYGINISIAYAFGSVRSGSRHFREMRHPGLYLTW
ncbi:MAG TPA: hypothetical protein VGD31_14575 [Sphingobacteriaceae bacterium]